MKCFFRGKNFYHLFTVITVQTSSAKEIVFFIVTLSTFCELPYCNIPQTKYND